MTRPYRLYYAGETNAWAKEVNKANESRREANPRKFGKMEQSQTAQGRRPLYSFNIQEDKRVQRLAQGMQLTL